MRAPRINGGRDNSEDHRIYPRRDHDLVYPERQYGHRGPAAEVPRGDRHRVGGDGTIPMVDRALVRPSSQGQARRGDPGRGPEATGGRAIAPGLTCLAEGSPSTDPLGLLEELLIGRSRPDFARGDRVSTTCPNAVQLIDAARRQWGRRGRRDGQGVLLHDGLGRRVRRRTGGQVHRLFRWYFSGDTEIPIPGIPDAAGSQSRAPRSCLTRAGRVGRWSPVAGTSTSLRRGAATRRRRLAFVLTHSVPDDWAHEGSPFVVRHRRHRACHRPGEAGCGRTGRRDRHADRAPAGPQCRSG